MRHHPTNKPFVLGELVKIIEGTHDPAMPEHRTGLIVEVRSDPHSRAIDGSVVYMVQFGTHVLKFHPMWLEKVS